MELRYESTKELNNALHAACKRGDELLARQLIAAGATQIYSTFTGACEGGNLALVMFLIEMRGDHPFDWDAGLYNACNKGHRELMSLMLLKGATDFNTALAGACEGGHLDLAQMMLDKGATDYELGLWAAAVGEKPLLAKFMIEMGATDFSALITNWSRDLQYSLFCGLSTDKKRLMATAIEGLADYALEMNKVRFHLRKRLKLADDILELGVWEKFLVCPAN
jgi:hypothetical protein